MNKYICILAIILLAPTLHAEEAQPAPTRQNILLERIEKQKENYSQNLQEARAIAQEYRQANSPEQKELLRKESRNGFMVRLVNATKKLGELQDRIQERITLAKEKGLATEEAEEKLALSKKHLQLVIDEQAKLETILNKETVTKTEVKQSFDIIKENLGKARASLIESMQIIKKVVVESLQNKDTNGDKEDENEDNNEETNTTN